MNNARNIAKPDPSPDGLAETHVPDSLAGNYQPRFSLPSGARPLDGYTIKRGVGAGGFGEVYYATSDAGKDVALKRIQRNLDIELRGVRQCLNLKHPNLLSLFDIRYDDEGQAWVVMEYVCGENLQSVIERNPNGMPLDQVHFWFDGITAGVGHLHDCGIVHRDLKPGNIFLDQSTVKIGDYGLSKFISCSRRSGQTQSVGTFHYMAPEIGQGRYGKEIDIYALGIILFEMLTGRVPYDGESSQEIIMKHLTALPPVNELASPYREVIERALAKDPGARFASVAQMRAVFEGAAPPAAAPKGISGPPLQSWGAASFAPSANTSDPAPANHDPAQEPLRRALQTAWREMMGQWEKLSTFWRIALVVALLALVLINSNWLIPLALAAAAYGMVSYHLRERRVRKQRAAADRASNTAAAVPVKKRESRRARRERVRNERLASYQRARLVLSRKSSGQRWTELLGALLMVSLVAGVIGVAACILVVQVTGARRFELIPNFLWIVLSSTFASWGVLFLSKLWEGATHDHGLRRFPMLILGFMIGATAFGLSRFLAFEPARVVPIEAISGPNPGHLHAADGSPLVGAYLIYFGVMFFVARWWLQADPMRPQRVSLAKTAAMVGLAFVLDSFFQVPQGFLIAMTSSLAIQFAAPWITPDERQRLMALDAGAEIPAFADHPKTMASA